MILIIPILIYLACVNVGAYCAFAADKRFAVNKEKRTPEAILLHWARIGGWGGVKLAQHRLRHKSYKQPFGSQLNRIGIMQATCVTVFAGVFAALALAPANTEFTRLAQTAKAATQDEQPVDGLLAISLRPPVARPVAW